MTDPSVAKMTPTQWLFELESLAVLDERRYTDIADLFKLGRDSLIDLLGLNIMPIETMEHDEDGTEYSVLRRPKEHEILPLSLLCGSESIISEVLEKNKQYLEQEELNSSISKANVPDVEELEEFFGTEDDLEFPDDPVALEKMLKWNSESTKATLKSMVEPMESKDDELFGKVEKTKPKSKVRIDG
jgi:hypothetical protein